MISRVLIANRGEIAVRIARTCADLGIATVAVAPADDMSSAHIRSSDTYVELSGVGVAAYLDADQLIRVAVEADCDALHPGYGFLSERASFATQCAAAGLVFIGPSPEALAIFGDKAAARALAVTADVAVLRGTSGPTTLSEAHSFLASLGDGGAVMVKALAGGGGRGMRQVTSAFELDESYARCVSEATQAFGVGDVYVEELLVDARHVEVQILGDEAGAVAHLGERDCSLQRRHQKFIEVAPAPFLSASVRHDLSMAALRLAAAGRYNSVGTMEFLVGHDGRIAFIEGNARLQVEHTITEELWGVDLVAAQFHLADGGVLAELALPTTPRRGWAIQLRVNLEEIRADGTVLPGGGAISTLALPSGPGVRVDTYAYSGYTTSPRYDSLLAKVIVRSEADELAIALRRARRAVAETRVEGASTNTAFLDSVMGRPELLAGWVTTRFVEDHLLELVADLPDQRLDSVAVGVRATVGQQINRNDPLAILDLGRQQMATAVPGPDRIDDGTHAVDAPMQGTIVTLNVAVGDTVRVGQQVAVMEAMKLEHVIDAPIDGIVRSLSVLVGDTVLSGERLASLEAVVLDALLETATLAVDLDEVRPDLAEVHARHAIGLDAARPDSVARRRKTGQRTARENIDQLCDDGSFVEYGSVVIAAQRRRRPVQELIERTPADGMVTGVGSVNHHQAVVMSYDFTVLAGTQGTMNHRKKDRMFELAAQQRLPVVLFAEGGGGRPGDTDGTGVAGLDCLAFRLFAELSALVPLVGITSGRCFAGNAALLGCCDVIIATTGSNIGMGGPAMVEGGGLGIFRPEDIGPLDVQLTNGVVDIAVADEVEAVEVARRYLAYFQGPIAEWTCADQRLLRRAIPENRLRAYDIRKVIHTMFDMDSVLELRPQFGVGMITALARVEGRALGVVANNPNHLAGAIDSDGADKASRFMQLCDAHDLPLVFLCDTPGIMVGPESEASATVRHASRMFVTSASVSVPVMTIVLRKGYGLGAQAMAGGGFKAPLFTIAWPTGEFGGMGLEGAVKLGYRNELAAITDPAARTADFEERVARMYEHGKALNTASHFEIDEVIDPLESRRWISSTLRSAPPAAPRTGKKRPCIDTW